MVLMHTRSALKDRKTWTKALVQSRSATKTWKKKKNALDNEKLAARDSAYCLHFSALAFYIFQHRLDFTFISRLSLFLSLSLSLFLGWMTMRSARCDSRHKRIPRESIFLPLLFHAVDANHVMILRLYIKCVNILKQMHPKI